MKKALLMQVLSGAFFFSKTGAEADGERHGAEERGEGGHHDRPEPEDGGFVYGRFRRNTFYSLSFDRKVDHDDGVLLDNADQQDHADHRDDVELLAEEHQR